MNFTTEFKPKTDYDSVDFDRKFLEQLKKMVSTFEQEK